MPTGIHPSAIVDAGAQLGDACRVWQFLHIGAGAPVGNRCSFGKSVHAGNDVAIPNDVSVYDAVTLDDLFCGPRMVFTNVYNRRAAVVRKEECRPTPVRRGPTQGASCAAICGTKNDRCALIGAGALADGNLQDLALVVGVPGRQAGRMSHFGERIVLPIEGRGEAHCPHAQERHLLEGGNVRLRNDDDDDSA